MKVKVIILMLFLLVFSACEAKTNVNETLQTADISTASVEQQQSTQESTHSLSTTPKLPTPTPVQETRTETTQVTQTTTIQETQPQIKETIKETQTETTQDTSNQNGIKVETVSLPNGFRVIKVPDNDHIFGIAEPLTPAIFTISTSDIKYFAPSIEGAWRWELSPDQKKVVYFGDSALVVVELDSNATEKVDLTEINEKNPYDEWISVYWLNNNKLLYNSGYEWFANSYIYDLESKTFTEVKHGFDGYAQFFSFIPIDEDRVLLTLRANEKKDGTSHYTESGFRDDLAIYDIPSGTVKKITDNEDGEFYSFVIPRGNKLYMKKRVVKDEKLIGVTYEIMELDSGNITKVNIDTPDVVNFIDENQYLTSQEGQYNNIAITYHYFGKSYKTGDFNLYEFCSILEDGAGIINDSEKVIRFEISR